MIKKPIVISMGEPSGIGTEILVKSWIERKKKKINPFFVVDNFLRFKSMINYLKLKATAREIKNPSETSNIFDDHHVGGYQELRALEKEQKLEDLIK